MIQIRELSIVTACLAFGGGAVARTPGTVACLEPKDYTVK